MNYAEIKKCDVANGPGVRVSLFVSGCTHHCKECFNPETWNFNYGQLFTEDTEAKILKLMEPDYIKGLTLLGGEPLEYCNQQGLLPLLRKVKKLYPAKAYGVLQDMTLKKMLQDVWWMNGRKQRNCFLILMLW